MSVCPEDILKRDFSEDFVQKMRNRIVVSHYKYGWMSDTYPENGDAIASLEECLELYKKTGNLEHLIDAGNFSMIEYMDPRHPDAHVEAEDSDKSPGESPIKDSNMCFQDWLRARIRLVGEELIRRSEELNLGGLDVVTAVDINVHIPTSREEIGWPSLNISFDCGEQKYVDALVSGEMGPNPPSQRRDQQ